MTSRPKVFISFSQKDSKEVRTLHFELEQQGVDVWDYSKRGEGLPLGKPLDLSLKKRIDSSDYFIAVITPNSVSSEIAPYCRFEVLYALSTEKLPQDKILPIMLTGPDGSWQGGLELDARLESIMRFEINSFKNDDFERRLEAICEWLSIKYVPSALRRKKAFFAKAFLKEADSVELRHTDFVVLMDIMNSCAVSVERGDWQTAKEKADLFLKWARHTAPDVDFYYPLIVRGVCELELNKPETAKETFLNAISDERHKNNPLYGLGFAGLGHTLFTTGQYDEALSAFQDAARFMKDDKYLLANQLDSMIQSGSNLWDDTVLDDLDLAEFPKEYHSQFLRIRGAAKYEKGKFVEAAQIFDSIGLDKLDETSAIYYAMTLHKSGAEESALDVILRATERIKSADIYHYLAYCYFRCGRLDKTFSVYEDILCNPDLPDNWTRQYFMEYARLLKNTEDKSYDDAIQFLCEKVLDFDLLSFPRSREDFFYLGYANYLLGRTAEARLDYERSAGFSEYFYDQILAQ
jgi:tetratricopeptide (TPR) repeat protein